MSNDEPINPPIGSESPETPTRSLPSYREPTPETHQKLTREEEAELTLKHTVFSPGTNVVLVFVFLITIAVVPAFQFGSEFAAVKSGQRIPTFRTFAALATRLNFHLLRHPRAFWAALPRPDELKSVEKTLQADSVVAQRLLPSAQFVITGLLHAGNEQVYPGRDHWLFFRPDVDYITSENFLDPDRLKRRGHSAGVQPDPIKAIVDFRDQLKQRHIDLLVMPVPVKPGIEGGKLSTVATSSEFLENPGWAEFKTKLQEQKVRFLDVETILARQRASSASSQYLKADTHWLPATMEFVAQALMQEILSLRKGVAVSAETKEEKVTGLGDLAHLLKVPSGEMTRYAEEATIHPVSFGKTAWHPSQDAAVLLLGDSFANIFSQSALGWGESAGLAEQLSFAMGGEPIDCILRNSDGAFATREILGRELNRGRDRLAGKKVVIWEFAMRELAFGDWKAVDLTLRPPPPSHFFTPPPGKTVTISGTIESVSPVPRPGAVPYADHIMSLHLVDGSISESGGGEALQCLIYMMSMRDNVWTPAARLRPGDHVTLRLRAWTDVANEYEKINRSEIDDPAIQLEEPAWGEPTD